MAGTPAVATSAAAAAGSGRPKVVVIVGPTGSGKSALAIDLALALSGDSATGSAAGATAAEILNADAMQLYAGLDTATAKVVGGERCGVPHHLMSCLPALPPPATASATASAARPVPPSTFTVRDYAAVAGYSIDDVTRRGRLPIVVGGTAYYVQALLRPSLLDEDEIVGGAADGAGAGAGASATAAAAGASGGGAAAESPYERLRRVDPVMAERYHPNDTRKIARALQVYDGTGIPFSEVLRRKEARLRGGESAAASDGSSVGSGDAGGDSAAEDAPAGAGSAATALSSAPTGTGSKLGLSAQSPYDCFVIHVTVSDKRVHDARLDARVDKMLASGLLPEIVALRRCMQAAAAGDAAATAAAVASLTVDTPSPLTMTALDWHQRSHGKAFAAPTATPAAAALAGSGSATAGAPAAAAKGDGGDGAYRGLLQAIGFKEFGAFLDAAAAAGVDPLTVSPPTVAEATARLRKRGAATATATAAATTVPAAVTEALAVGVLRLAEVTHAYARSQAKFIRNRFAARGIPLWVVDTSAVPVGTPAAAAAWREGVMAPALAAVRAFLARADGATITGGDAAADAVGLAALAAAAPAAAMVDAGYDGQDVARLLAWRKHTCEVCNRTLNGEHEWGVHVRSRGHRGAAAAAARREALLRERGITLPVGGKRGRQQREGGGDGGGDGDGGGGDGEGSSAAKRARMDRG